MEGGLIMGNYKDKTQQEYKHDWYIKNKEKILILRKKNYKRIKNTIKYKSMHLRCNTNYVKNNPLKIKARNLSIRIPLKQNCEICNSVDGLQKHHWRYDKPLLVNTLCSYCHKVQHCYVELGGI